MTRREGQGHASHGANAHDLLGATVRIRTGYDETFQGEIYGYDVKRNAVMLAMGMSEISNGDQVSFAWLRDEVVSDLQTLGRADRVKPKSWLDSSEAEGWTSCDLDLLQERREAALAAARKENRHWGVGVTAAQQRVYDSLRSRIEQVREEVGGGRVEESGGIKISWDRRDIVVTSEGGGDGVVRVRYPHSGADSVVREVGDGAASDDDSNKTLAALETHVRAALRDIT